MVNKEFTFISMLLNFMSPLDVNAGAYDEISIFENNHPFFIWMSYYKDSPHSEEVMEKMIRKGLNLNYILLPQNKTVKDICLENNDYQPMDFLKRIDAWESMRCISEL